MENKEPGQEYLKIKCDYDGLLREYNLVLKNNFDNQELETRYISEIHQKNTYINSLKHSLMVSENELKNLKQIISDIERENIEEAKKFCPFCGEEHSHMSECHSVFQRLKLLIDFEEALNLKLKKKGFCCYYKCSYNWFKSEKSRKRNLPVWSGFYKCIQPNCKSFIRPFIKSINKDEITVCVSFLTKGFHEPIDQQTRITGEDRINLSYKLNSEGTSNVSDFYQIISYQKKNPIKKTTLYKIKNEFDHRFRLSRDLFFDLKASKLMTDNLSVSNSGFTGLVHNVSIDPYGFFLMSEMQIDIWKQVKFINPVWHFDSTGCIHKDVESQKKPFLYSIVFHDIENKNILPICEFISTDHTIRNISRFLKIFLDRLADFDNETEFKIAPIIVTDFSWALINSVLNIFNKMEIIEYLEFSFKRIIEKNNLDLRKLTTRIYLCSTHFLKSLVKKVKKFDISSKHKNLFIFCFSLLQNSLTIQQFENYLINIFNVFTNPYKSESVSHSLDTLRSEIRNRELNKLNFSDINCKSIPNDQGAGEFDIAMDETIETLKVKSPFSKYYQKVIEEWKIKIESNIDCMRNEFFEPRLFDLIKTQLYILPFWCGILLHDFKQSTKNDFTKAIKSRLSNNPVENYFGNLKHNVLPGLKLYPSEIISCILLRIKSKYFEFYFNDAKNKIVKNNDKLSSQKEKWSKNFKKISKNKRNLKFEIDGIKEKGYYFKNYDIGKLIYKDLFEFDPIFLATESQEYKDLFEKLELKDDKYLDSMEIAENSSCQEKDVNNFENLDLIILYEDLIKKDWSFLELKKYFYSSSKLLKNLVNGLREIIILPIFLNQICEIKEQFKIILKQAGLENHIIVKSKSNGNCFYNSISTCLFGKEEKFYLIKIGVIFIMLEYEDLFRSIVKEHHYELSYETIVCNSSRENEWAMMLNIFATSILLNRSIFSFNLNHETFKIYFQEYLQNDSCLEPLKIAFYLNHFNAILCCDPDKNQCMQPPLIKNDLFVNFRDKYKIKFY
ncbi:unnamed protein product [Brachionus calyciflorus]|uniref:OTU domain-containing protein n=1 Tax=Brachionus calyciflorus TaxID=104777 RepID=A0A814BWH8_9BILA|nr:unnamed protein product [Brachionus calyciflorus]